MLRERLEGFARYNAWEKEQERGLPVDLDARLAWLEEAYAMARSLGALRPLPASATAWLEDVRHHADA